MKEKWKMKLQLSSEEMDFIAGYISGCLGEKFIQGGQKVDFTREIERFQLPASGYGAPSGTACEITLKFIAPLMKENEWK